ncbi:UDP-4-amino-4,6-dideoxy-N-acetyl-beta-L-altrosamine transaminase [Kordiimonas aquimaris]|uniref:UDP-4-amino-4, 6-dideoxy-N-acetyl-beta-L-altrosamine transaminase n=1 Tax=Kordiimonas aquimaris TaxID=707591 RepID=UPI0021D09F4A|nr:UDP-4-amino-4,6-dideoxy-N-acetyl-beta-L-altrosamine transaminase [Kordiimonas aquimaris]
MSADKFLPYGRHAIDDADIEAVVDVLKSGMLTCGPQVERFETAFASYIGAKHAVVCSNGTAALHMAAIECGLGPGDTAIVPAITFLATANAVRMTGADVCFADVCPDSGLMTAETFSDALDRSNSPVKAVLPVHMNGQSGEIQKIAAIARKKDIRIITDCCHALGSEYFGGGRPGDGQYEEYATFSLHPVKSIAMGEGGVVTTNDAKAAQRLRMLRGHAMERNPESWQNGKLAFAEDGSGNPWYYEMDKLAYNYRATDMQCALGLSQLKKLDDFIKKRRQIADWYDEKLKSLSNRLQPIDRSAYSNSAWHLYAVLIDFELCNRDRGALMRYMLEQGVGSQVHYVPVSNQPYYRKLYGKQDLPGTHRYYDRVLSLPIFPDMSEADVEKVVTVLSDALN